MPRPRSAHLLSRDRRGGRGRQAGLFGVSRADGVPRVRPPTPGEGRRVGRLHRAGASTDHPSTPPDGLTSVFAVRRIRATDGPLLRSIRLAALADAPGDNNTTLARAQAHDADHWTEAASVNSLGGLQATFFAEATDGAAVESGGDGGESGGQVVGMLGAYSNRD